MKTTLFIGSQVLDIIVHIDHLPVNKEDINTDSVQLSIGGCAYNASGIVEHFGLPMILCSPIGQGPFASLMEGLMSEQKRKSLIRVKDMDNGCCICLVDRDGERTFICHHGAEYLFQSEWLKEIDPQELDYIYVCGLELEDKNGDEILNYLENTDVKVFFAPGARIMNIQEERMKRLLALHPIMHLNEDEAIAFTGDETVSRAAQSIYAMTHELVIVTCGERGAYYTDGNNSKLIEGSRVKVVDTIGAGDAHAGACISGLKQGLDLDEIIRQANRIAATVVGTEGGRIKEGE